MATDIERLILVMEANVNKLAKEAEKGRKDLETQLNGMEGAAKKTNERINKQMNFAPRIETANIAAQFQDIAVQMQQGINPLTIALQQGTQLSAALGPGRGLAGTAQALGAAFASVISPVSLATLAVIGLSGAAIQYFTTTSDSAAKVDAVLKQHSDLIGQIKDRYGEAAEGLRDYARESQQVLQFLTTANAGKLREQLDELSKSFVEAQRNYLASVDISGGQIDAAYQPLIQAIRDLVQSANNGTPDMLAFRNVLAEIANTTPDAELRKATSEMLEQTDAAARVQRALESAAQSMSTVANAAAGATGSVSEFSGALRELAGIALNLTAAERAKQALDKALANSGDAKDATAALNEYNAALIRIKKEEDERAAKKRKRKEPLSREEKAANEFNKDLERQAERTQDLYAETRALAMANFEAQRYRVEQELLQQARRAGIALTPEILASIDAEANAYAEASENYRKAREAAQHAQEQTAFFGNLITDAFSDMVVNGAKAEDVLKRIAAALAQAAIEAAILGKGPLANLFGGASGGGLFGLLGGLFGGGTAPGRAGGGMVGAGRMYRVNELGSTEGFVPLTPGRVLTKQDMRGGGGGPAITFAPVTQVAAGVTAPELRAILDQRDQQWRRTLPALIKDAAGRRQL